MTAPTTAAPSTDTQFSTREVPWMKLGKLADHPVTAVAAAKLGGLDFEVEKRAVYFDSRAPQGSGEAGHHTPKKIAERVAVVRTDTEQWLGLMSKDYPVLQYSEAFDFMDQAGPAYVAAGALKGGRQGFIVARATGGGASALTSWDPHEIFLVLRTSHDGSRAVEVMFMPLRQRCMNQLTLRSFSTNVPYRWSVKHTSSMPKKLADAQDALTRLDLYRKSFDTTALRLVKIKITEDVARQVLQDALPDRPRRDDQIDQLISTWHTAETVGFDWTGWGLVNAVSEYFDWGRAGGTAESRFVGALQGQTHNTINRVAGRLLSRV